MAVTELLQIKEMGSGHDFIREMQRMSQRAADGNEETLRALESMLMECIPAEAWQENNRWCSAVIHALVQTRTPESMMAMLRFIELLPDAIHYGAIDLISSLLPLYRRFIIHPAKQMTEAHASGPQRSIGIQTLCNMMLEGMLGEDDVLHLEKILKEYRGDRWLSHYHVELARSAISSWKQLNSASNEDLLVSLYDDILVGL